MPELPLQCGLAAFCMGADLFQGELAGKVPFDERFRLRQSTGKVKRFRIARKNQQKLIGQRGIVVYGRMTLHIRHLIQGMKDAVEQHV